MNSGYSRCAAFLKTSSFKILNFEMADDAVRNTILLDILKKKMSQTKKECEKFKEEAKDLQRKLQIEINRREKAESDVVDLKNRVQFLEEDLERMTIAAAL